MGYSITRQSSVPDNGGQPWSFLWMPSVEPVPAEESIFPDLTPEQRSGLFAATIMPNFLFAATAHNGVWYQLEPRGHDAMDLKIHVLLPPEVAASLSAAEKKEIGELISVIHLEDIAANEGPWRGLHGALTKRLGRIRNRLDRRLDADIKLSLDVYTHAIMGDQCLFGVAANFQPQRVHIDRDGFVENWKHQRAAIHDDFLPAKSGPYKGHFFGRPFVKPRENQSAD